MVDVFGSLCVRDVLRVRQSYQKCSRFVHIVEIFDFRLASPVLI
jgi:hypothetical protein